MNKYIFIIIMLLTGSISAIDFIKNDTTIKNRGNEKANLLFHNETDDYHYFGTEKVAVLFDVRQYFNSNNDSLSSALFTTGKALIYFPTTTSDITITLKKNNFQDVGITKTIASCDAGWNTIEFSESIEDSVLILVVEYETSINGSFFSASKGNGTNSYFWDNETNLFQNMLDKKNDAEFLFGLIGSFSINPTNLTDVFIEEIIVEGNIQAGSEISSTFVLRNSTNNVALDYTLYYQFEYPKSSQTAEPFPILEIPANDTIHIFVGTNTFIDDGSGYQYRLKGSLISQNDLNSNNNIKEKNYNIFTEESDDIFVENFLTDNTAEYILAQENDDFNERNYIILNYFPDRGDSLYTKDSDSRFNFYQMPSFPNTVLDGDVAIDNYNQNTFSTIITKNLSDNYPKNIVASYDSFELINSDTGIYDLNINITNNNTYFLSNYSSDLRFFAVIAEKGISGNENSYNFLQFLSSVDGEALTSFDPNPEEPMTITLKYNLEKIIPINDITKMKVIFWIQYQNQEILFSSMINVTEINAEIVQPIEIEEIVNLDSLTLNQDFIPQIKIMNNTNTTVYNLLLELNSLENDVQMSTVIDSIVRNNITIPMTEPINFQEDNSQYKIDLTISQKITETIYNELNTKTFYSNFFPNQKESVFIENFFDTDNSVAYDNFKLIDNIAKNNSKLIPINYFYNEEIYNPIKAKKRFQFYNFIDFPKLTCDGNIEEFDNFEETSIKYLQGKTFISDTINVQQMEDNDYLIEIVLNNENETKVQESYIDDLNFYAIIVQDSLLLTGGSKPIFATIFADYLTSSDGLNISGLTKENPQSNILTFELPAEFIQVKDESIFSLIFYVQNSQNHNIDFVKKIPVTELSAYIGRDDNKIVEANSIKLFPNPFSLKSPLTIEIFNQERIITKTTISFYNIKGQKVKTLIENSNGNSNKIIWNGKNEHDKQIASGIYLMKFDIETTNETSHQTKKCLFLK